MRGKVATRYFRIDVIASCEWDSAKQHAIPPPHVVASTPQHLVDIAHHGRLWLQEATTATIISVPRMIAP